MRTSLLDATVTPLADLRVLVAPSTGRFEPVAGDPALGAGAIVGHVTGGRGRRDPVHCPVEATTRALLALPGQHVTTGQALVWVAPR